MASYLQIENISKSYGPKVLFENIGFNVNEGDKIALIAPNGTGKTSLLRILAGEDSSDSGGKVLFLKDIRIAFLKQEYDCDPNLTIMEQVTRGRSGPEYLQKVKEFLTNFNLTRTDKKMGELSGGEVKRVALSEMLASQADFLIMDEPTNHLDIEAIEYLEGYLKRSRCTLLMVTHDRYFLDRVCNTVMELDRGAVYIYKGDYQNYLEKRQERIAAYNSETDKVRNLLRRELEWIRATPCARTGKAKYRIDAFHELSDRASRVRTEKRLSMEGIGTASRLGNKIIDCKHLGYDWQGHVLLKDFSYNFQRLDKIGIVGRNGAGKSTFLDLLTGRLEPGEGVIERGESLSIGYYRQEGMAFDEEQTVLDVVSDTRMLARFLFPHDMLSTRVSRLSGGEKRRLYLLTVLMKSPNLLILDEPTNDLDIVTLNILEEYLAEYGGSLLVVSHDRHFLDRVTDHLLVFCGEGRVKDFIGSFSEYRAFIKDEQARRRGGTAKGLRPAGAGSGAQVRCAGPAEGPAANAAGPSRPRKLSYKEQKELESIEQSLPLLEEEKAGIEQSMSDGGLPYEELRRMGDRINEIIAETDRLETRWLELQI